MSNVVCWMLDLTETWRLLQSCTITVKMMLWAVVLQCHWTTQHVWCGCWSRGDKMNMLTLFILNVALWKLWLWLQCVEVLLEKFREKKPVVVQALKDAIDAVYCTVCASAAAFYTIWNYNALTVVILLIFLWISNM